MISSNLRLITALVRPRPGGAWLGGEESTTTSWRRARASAYLKPTNASLPRAGLQLRAEIRMRIGRGLRDCGTTGPQDYETTRLRQGATAGQAGRRDYG